MTLKLNGSSSGSVSIDAPASTAGGADRTLTLPDDASNGVIKTSTYPSSIQVLEQFYTPCDGSTIATSQGNITVPNVTAALATGLSWTDVTGSAITYTPPTGTTQVIYHFNYVYIGYGSTGFTSVKLLLAGTEVTDARRHENGVQDYARTVNHQWGFNIGGTANAATGRVASWSSGKEIKLQAVDYGSGNRSYIHQLHYWEDQNVTDFPVKPCIGITAIGAA